MCICIFVIRLLILLINYFVQSNIYITEAFENQVYEIIKDTDVKENVFIKSKLEKENIKKRKKRRCDTASKVDDNVSRKRHKFKSQANNCFGEKNVLASDGDRYEESYDVIENKFSTRLRMEMEEQLTSTVSPPQRKKSNRLRVKNNNSISCNTTER